MADCFIRKLVIIISCVGYPNYSSGPSSGTAIRPPGESVQSIPPSQPQASQPQASSQATVPNVSAYSIFNY